MDTFVVGDVHGCFYTFSLMLKKHWDSEKERLIQLGDLVDRGNYSPQTVGFARELVQRYPDRVVFLKGNHDFEMTEHFRSPPNPTWLWQGGEGTLQQYETSGRSLLDDVDWLSGLPLFWENSHLFASHAGIAESAEDPFDEGSPEGILWNRSKLKNLGKLQIVGHTPQKEVLYSPDSHAYYIDTGAVYSNRLTGVKISKEGEIRQFVSIPTDKRDVTARLY